MEQLGQADMDHAQRQVIILPFSFRAINTCLFTVSVCARIWITSIIFMQKKKYDLDGF